MNKNTSWEGVSKWYDEYLEGNSDSYQEKVILPNLLRIMDVKKGESVLDIACGQGYFSRALRNAGASVTGVDLSGHLIEIAKNHELKLKPVVPIAYHKGSADKMSMIKDGLFDKALIVLALQNIKNINLAITEAGRVLKKEGKLFIVLNHPTFRIPQASSWEFDEKASVQYRRIEKYLGDMEIKIDMTPGEKISKKWTYSYHRPLQVYVKTLVKNNLYISRLEEWISHKQSEKGKRSEAENNARKEIPLFLLLEAVKVK